MLCTEIGFPEIGPLEIQLSRTPPSTALSALVFFLNLFLGLSDDMSRQQTAPAVNCRLYENKPSSIEQ